MPKTKAGEKQHVPLSSEALEILGALGPGDVSAPLLSGAQAGGHVFAWKDGQPWTPDYVTHAFAKAVQNAGITNLHVHDTRHTFACRLLRRGVDIYTVSKLLRHASVVMSERYAHLSAGDLRKVVCKATPAVTATNNEMAKELLIGR